MNKIPITINGEKRLREELDELTRVKRPKIIEAISKAREHGDLKENAEYHAARESQSFIEGRIQDIESKLSNAEVIDPLKINTKDVIVFSATVKILDDNDNEKTYQIVGDDEADLKYGLISINSPIARGLIGKRIDDEVSVETPNGVQNFTILEITYG
ncbi:MAG: transcription elongation factor GreA [Thiotrichaceae bacterium]|jgi:transcription elongation factor GreA|nr:MAG: transcription elongation factor GreA [Thiotrichaceae bacterium]|tara:strand:- start:698 stop:1171 length:474 start_codon:yes stop_codon:yes gene_type:complete